MPAQPSAPAQAPAPATAPTQVAGPGATQAPAGSPAQDLKPVDLGGFIDMLSKGQPNLLLGHLFVEAGFLPEPLVEAALKVQELVRQGHLSNQGAVEALKRAAERGGFLDEETLASCRASYPVVGEAPPRPANAGAQTDPREAARQVIMLIHNAGIVSENDISTAESVRRKHGGDVGSILVAAGKIERFTLDAARGCYPLVRDSRLNMDEAVRILRHCQKNKASLEDACRDLAIRVI
jgi:hypothetical protein